MFQLTQESTLIGQAELMQRMFDGDDLSQTAQHLINTCQSDPNNAEALADLSSILLLRGDQK